MSGKRQTLRSWKIYQRKENEKSLKKEVHNGTFSSKKSRGVQAKQQIKYQYPEEKQHWRVKHLRFFISS